MGTNKSKTKVVNIGTSSLLVVFLSLCLTAFAILSLSSAKSDYEFSEKMAERTTAYYEANNEAQRTLASIDQVLGENAHSTISDASQAALEAYGVTLEGDSVCWQVPVNDSQALDVELLLTPGEAGIGNAAPGESATDSTTPRAAGAYKIIKWQVVNIKDWTSDQTLDLISIP